MLSLEVKAAIAKAAEASNLDAAKLAAVVEVESAGVIFWHINGINVPTILTEAHYFYKLTSGEARAKAVAGGLAAEKWRAIPYPKTALQTWDRYARMKAIDPVAAVESCSWGVGQVMGNHWKEFGYESAEAFVAAQMTVDGQIDSLLREIKWAKLANAINIAGVTADSWRAFAKGYNGASYERLNYHGKIAAAYKHHIGESFLGTFIAEVNPKVRIIQNELRLSGHWTGTLDGLDNPALHDAIATFQAEHGLNPDGLYGPITQQALAVAIDKAKKAEADKDIRAGAVASASIAIGHQIIEQLTPLQALGVKALQVIAAIGIMAAVALIAFGLYRKAQLVTATATSLEAKDDKGLA